MTDTSYYLRLFAPIVTGMGTAALVPSMKNRGSKLPQTPPGWVFGVVWVLLYVSLGYTWAEWAQEDSTYADTTFIILVTLLVLWIIVATGIQWRWSSPQKAIRKDYIKASLYIIVLATMASFVVLVNAPDTLSQVGSSVFTGWLLFATHLNYHDVKA